MRNLLHSTLLGCLSVLVAMAAADTGVNPTGDTGQSVEGKTLEVRAVEVQPDSLRKYRFLAKASREQKDYSTAATYYRKVLTYKPSDQKAAYFLGTCLVKEKRPGLAKDAFLLSSHLDSTHLNTNLTLTQIFLREAKPDSARQYLSRVSSAKRGLNRGRELRRQLADQYRRKGHTAAAIEQYRLLVEIDAAGEATPNDRAELFKLLADLHRDAGMTSEALIWQQRLLAHHEAKDRSAADRPAADRISILNDLADLQAGAGSEKAYETLRALVELDPDNRYAYYERLLSIATERGDEALRLEGLEGMVRANPKDLPTLAVLAEFHLDHQAPVRAEQWLQKGLSVDPGHGRLHILMGDLLLARGAPEQALTSFEKALEDSEWNGIAQQRIWQIRPPETTEEKLKREFFGGGESGDDGGQ